MSQRSEKLHRRVSRLEEQVQFLQNSADFDGIFRDIQQEREEKEDRVLHTARKRAREAERAARMWRALAWAAVLVALVVLFLALQDRAQATEAEPDPDPVSAQVIQYSLPPEPMPEIIVEEPARRLHGSCRITAYCSCEICCGEWSKDRPLDADGNPIVYGASGQALTPGVSAACSLPYGTEIQIDGLPGTYVVEDRTAEWIQDKYNGMTVDIYMDSHEACYELLAGMPEWMDVYVIQ